jgi:succinate dehydrogenase / fumarate reductase cytochrome b subunit
MVASFQRVPVALVYVVANLALALHLYHGAWSLFQSLGWNNPRFNHWRRRFATGFTAVVLLGNLSFPILIVTGVVDEDESRSATAATEHSLGEHSLGTGAR